MPLRSLLLVITLLSSALAPATEIEVRRQQQQPPLPAQQKPDPPRNQDQVLRLSSQLVLVPVSVSDAAGRPVRNLTLEDFIVEEEGRPQQLVSLGEPGKAPIDIAILFDVSLSIRAQFEFERQASIRFIKEVLKPSDTISIFSIGETPKIVKPRTSSTEEAVAGLMQVAPVKEPTAFFDSIVKGAAYLGSSGEPGSRRVLLAISDGEENNSKQHALNDSLQQLLVNDCLFYAINPSGSALNLNRVSLKGQGVMEAMSSATGGKAFLPEKIEDLDAVFRQITEELQAQYLFGYYSTDEKPDGSFKKITVRAAKRTDLRVRARQGYYSPKP